MHTCQKFLGPLVIVAFCAVSSPGLAFNLNKLLGGKLPGAASSGTPGGLPGGAKQEGEHKQVNSAFLDFMCSGKVDPKEFMHDAADDDLRKIRQAVAKDFDRSVEDTQAVLAQDGAGTLRWAEGLDFYKEAFDGDVIKRLFKNFIVQRENRIEIAGKIRYAIALNEDDPLEARDDLTDEDQIDASFAYALILAHYGKWNKKQSFTEGLLKSAYESDSKGANYVWGRRLYHGDGVPKNVNLAANILASSTQVENEEDVWEETKSLWNIIAVDPGFKHHQRYRNMAGQAAKMKAGVKRDLAKTQGSAGIKLLWRMEKLQAGAMEKLSKAFGFAKEYAEEAEEYKDLLNQANPDQQVVDKMVSMSEELHEFVLKNIGNTQKELDPQGIKMARDARKDIVKVAYINQLWMAKIMSGGIRGSGLAGGNLLSSVGSIAKPLANAMNNACGLYNAMDAYMDAKEVTLQTDTVEISSEEAKMFN